MERERGGESARESVSQRGRVRRIREEELYRERNKYSKRKRDRERWRER